MIFLIAHELALVPFLYSVVSNKTTKHLLLSEDNFLTLKCKSTG